MLNVKQRSSEYQLLKSLNLTQPGNRIQVYRLRDESSNYLSHAIRFEQNQNLATPKTFDLLYGYAWENNISAQRMDGVGLEVWAAG